MIQRLERIAINPVTYLVWAASLAAVLFAANRIDPYVFGFATIVAGWISVVPVAAGVVVAATGRSGSAGARAVILVSVIVIIIVVVLALQTLRRIHWA